MADPKEVYIDGTHIWQEYLDLAEGFRRTNKGKEIYARRKETIERVFADAKEKYGKEKKKQPLLLRITPVL